MDTIKRLACWLGIGTNDTCAYIYASDLPTDTFNDDEVYDPALENRVQELETRVSLIERRQQLADSLKERRHA